MRRPRLLVVSVVHHADDTRIREKLLRTLAHRWDITYRTRTPAPTDHGEITWQPLRGGRVVRNIRAAGALLSGRYEAAVVHDPELVPAAMAARMITRRPVVFDVHENVPAQIATKDWVPLRSLVARLAAAVLRAAEPLIEITLAEDGYRSLFRRDDHPTFPNYPLLDGLPEPSPAGDGRRIVYVGDVTAARGIDMLVESAPSGSDLLVIGPVTEAFASSLRQTSARRGIGIQLTGRLPHRLAMEECRGATVGVAPLRDTPNYRHSLPTKVLEYLAMGIPVVASDLPGTRKVVGDLDGVRLVPPGDWAAWSEALEEVMADEEIRRGAVAQAASVRERFRWPSHDVQRFYDRLVAG